MRTALLALLPCLALPAAAGAAAPPPRPPTWTGGSYEVRVVKDVAYRDDKGADPLKHRLDLYLPRGRDGFPVLFFVHGGTWRSGDKRLYGKLGEVFARNGVGTVIISYRLSPAVKHPAHIQDVAKAFAWTVKNIAKYGGKADEVFVSGHSAGGHLAALLATDESFLKAEKLSLKSVKGVLALSGVYLLPPGTLQKVFGTAAEVYRQASPLHHVKAGRPPFLLVYADRDYPTLGWTAERMAQALRKHKGEATTLEVKGRTHVSLMVRVADEADPTTQAMLRFIARHGALKLTPKARE